MLTMLLTTEGKQEAMVECSYITYTWVKYQGMASNGNEHGQRNIREDKMRDHED